MQDAPAATSTPTFQMFCFGQWSSSFPPSLCQPRWSSSRPAAIFQPRYLDYSFPDPSVNQHKACYGAMCILGPKRAIAVVKGAPGRFCRLSCHIGSEVWWGGEEEAFCETGAGCANCLSASLLTSNPRDQLPLPDFHSWNSEAHTALLIVTCLPSEQWELGQPDRHLTGATVRFCNWESPCKTHWNTILFFSFQVSVPPPNPPRLHLHIWNRK